MYSVSEDYKEAIRQRVVNDRIAGRITLSDGTSLTISDRSLVKNSLKISHELCDDYRIGTFHIGCLRIAFFDDNALLRDFSGARIEPVYEIETAKGWERVPMGIYYADGNSVRRKRSTVSLTAYDCGCFFDQMIPEERRSLSGSAQILVAAACADCGVPFGGIPETLPNYNVGVSAENTQIRTYRDMIAWCAELLCAYAVIDREGKLWFRSAKYGVSQTDNTDIVIDKYLTEAERDSIYVTDTRAYIRSICAYSGGVLKTYVSDTVQTDEQAAPAGYTFAESPLLPKTLTEEQQDTININRLTFIDGFKQRGINAEIYGDPALDAGDVLRCSGGDIDQRRSIVGLVTKQEWRYRNFHTVVCAAPPLLGRDAASAAVVTSQTDKKLDALSGKCEYTAGKGIEIEGKEIRLKPAQKGDSDFLDNLLGGIWLPYYDSGLDLDDNGRLRLVTASSGYRGGIYIGDGLLSNGTGVCSVDIGKGMRFNDRDDREYPDFTSRRRSLSPNLGDGLKSDPSEDEGESDYGKIHLNLGKGLEFGAREYEKKKDSEGNDTEEDDPTRYTSEVRLKLGAGMRFGADGELIAEGGGGKEYKAGENITISEDGTISAQVKEYTAGENVTISEDGEISATRSGVMIDQAVIITEADAKYLLHSFTEIEYNAGNKIGYAGPGNQIVVQGYLAYQRSLLYEGMSSKDANNTYALYPDGWSGSFSRYLEFDGDFYVNTNHYTKLSFGVYEANVHDQYIEYKLMGNGTANIARVMPRNYYRWSGFGLVLDAVKISPPGAVYEGTPCEFGFVNVRVWSIARIGEKISGGTKWYQLTWLVDGMIPFASLAEYQAAVGLTYEPLTLTEVVDNPTVVSDKDIGEGVT